MYKLDPADYITAEPWNLGVEQRIKNLFEAKKMGLKTAVYLYEGADTSTFRYRVYNVCQSLKLSLNWKGIYFFKPELKIVTKYVSMIDLVILGRFRWSPDLAEVIDILRRKKIKIAFDVDDCVYDIKYIPLIMNTLSVNPNDSTRCDYWFSYVGRVGMSAKMCDSLITTNAYLAENMKKDLQKECYIIPNYFNRWQEEVSKNYCSQKKRIQDKQFCIGYFSGTPSHINDFLTVAPEIRDLLYDYDDIFFKLVGFMEMPDFLMDFQKKGKIIRKPLMNYLDLQKEIAEVNVNIVPLVNNHFSNCKSELKFFEAGIVDVITCAAPSFVFKNVIKQDVNGYLCERGQWYDSILNIYKTNKIKRNMVEHAAEDISYENYAFNKQVSIIENVFDSINC